MTMDSGGADSGQAEGCTGPGLNFPDHVEIGWRIQV